MAQIISEQIAPDGFDVTVTLSNGERHTFHFQSKPANIQAAVDALETEWLEAMEPAYTITFEDGATV